MNARAPFPARAWLLAALAALSPATGNAAPGAHGPNGEHLEAPAAASPAGLARLPDGSVNVPMAAQRRLGLRTLIATKTQAAATVELSGRVLMDPNAGGRVQTAVGGRIEPGPRGLPVAGQRVQRGEVLAVVVHHVDPLAAGSQQAQAAELRAARLNAEQRVARLTGLEGTVPRKDIEAARTELDGLIARERAVSASLGARERLVAPISGVIARADAVAGQVVDGKDVLFEIVDPARVVVEAVTVDATLGAQVAAASLQGLDGVRLDYVGAARSLREGTLPLTFRASATRGQALPLAIGQTVTVIVQRRERLAGFVLPAQAVTRNAANEPVVWIKAGAERYLPQPVRHVPLDARHVLVTQGLGDDNRVLVEGASLVAQIR
jgi:hypothetical protein